MENYPYQLANIRKLDKFHPMDRLVLQLQYISLMRKVHMDEYVYHGVIVYH